MFFKVIVDFDCYPQTHIIRNKMILNAKYAERLRNRCEKHADRWSVSVHDALYHILSSGEIDRVRNSYIATGKI